MKWTMSLGYLSVLLEYNRLSRPGTRTKMRTLVDIIRVPRMCKVKFPLNKPQRPRDMSNKAPPCHADIVQSKPTPSLNTL